MNIINIELDDRIIKKAIEKYIEELIHRIDNPNKYTKFDSDNDIFIGLCGEYAFAKFLYNKGFDKRKDYFQIGLFESDEKFKDDFIEVDNFKYDKYDFKLNLLFDKNNNELESIKIDVKTQKYVGRYNDNWQFAVNGNTIDKLIKNENKIDYLSFIFTEYGIEDFINLEVFKKATKEELLIFKSNLTPMLKKKSIKLEILGVISPKNFIVLSEQFSKDEVFRINKTKEGEIKPFRTSSPMYRIDLKYLSNIDKIIPDRKIDININENIYNDMVSHLDDSKNVKVKLKDNKEILFPYDKIYLNSQYNNLTELFNKNLIERSTNIVIKYS